ncbi:MAG: dethiobiotin synthase [Flavipsychrobacter sp.]|nr:dethiobiotin synthase [Flavipsychrobacter sp.]
MNKNIAIAGIHTDIGKTIASAVIAEAISADYWKPVQAGNLDQSDTINVSSLISNGSQRVHKEAVRLTQPLSPHAAAAIDGINIDHTLFKWPVTNKPLLVETAGGLLSPISGSSTVADLLQYYKLPTLLISKNYLGSINHTLLSIEVMKARHIPILGLIINGDSNAQSEEFIETYTRLPIIARIPHMPQLSQEAISTCASSIKQALLQYL